jgi:hypothetical protein
MNHQQNPTTNNHYVLNLQITIPHEMMKSMVDQLAPVLVQQVKDALLLPLAPPPSERERKFAYSLKETAGLLGLCEKTVYRLIQRGLLKSSGALRTKLISEKEIQRFLAATQ